MRRYTGLNHLAQAARAVLQNSSQVSQMLHDLNKVDFANVQDQVHNLLNRFLEFAAIKLAKFGHTFFQKLSTNS